MQVDRQQPWNATLTSLLVPAGAAGALTVGEGAVQPPSVAECLPHRAVRLARRPSASPGQMPCPGVLATCPDRTGQPLSRRPSVVATW